MTRRGEREAELCHDYINFQREHPQSCLDSLNCENEIWLKKQTNTKIQSENPNRMFTFPDLMTAHNYGWASLDPFEKFTWSITSMNLPHCVLLEKVDASKLEFFQNPKLLNLQ